MSLRRPAAALALLAALGGLFPGAVPPRGARADGWEEMRAEFRRALKAEDWKERRDGFVYLTGHDRPEAVEEILSVLDRETNAAVVLAGVEALTQQKSLGSRELLIATVRKSGGPERLLVLNALARQKGKDVTDLLVEVLGSRDGPAVAQAALALREEKPAEALPLLLKLLGSKEWQVRRAVAMALASYGAPEAVEPLAKALGAATGRDRCDLIATLEKITGQAFGNDPQAWKKLAKGTDPAEIRLKPDPVPRVFGVPIYGERLVICLDNSLRMTDPHPFDQDRLKVLCGIDTDDPVPWYRLQTNGHFAHAHVKHLIQRLPKGTKLELITFNSIVRDTFLGWASVGSATRKAALDLLDSLIPDDGIASYDALNLALDRGGEKESAAWKKGPDEVVFITVNLPNRGEVTEADAVAAAIGLKAQLRMVPIHTVGIHYHPYDMCREIAERTGGVYVNLTE